MISKIFKLERKYRTLLLVILILMVLANFWVFARFTVDDAFITWRYGKNLVNHGIWNYNPSSLDMTQAYTNPIYAFLSIIPAYFKIDVVLFFKFVSIITIGLFAFYYTRKTKGGGYIILVLLIFPHTMIHMFSGIETFLFVAVSTALLISIYEESWRATIISSVLLLYTRPEAWTLFFIVPLVYCNWQSVEYSDIVNFRNYSWRNLLRFLRNFLTLKSILVFFILLAASLPNFIISYLNFNHIFPNTFFVKNAPLTLQIFERLPLYGLTLLPLLVACRYIPFRKLIPIILFYLPMILQYSRAELAMDYAQRFLYHIFPPIVLFILYLLNNIIINNIIGKRTITVHDSGTNKSISFNISFKYINVCKVITFLVLIIFIFRVNIRDDFIHISNYYYRCLSSHATAGKVIHDIKEKYNINSIACGDSGMLAYNADIVSLDLNHLGSKLSISRGIAETYSLYNPNILFLHGNEEEVRRGYYADILDLAPSHKELGKITYMPDYFLWVYSDTDIPELFDLFERSMQVNYKWHREVLLEHIFKPPWSQWHI